ncbi:MAG TPA: isoprenylcysteine carboxylmethyltransferase family protein [Casimicrobiaceae bacterium]|nr:isoprenylcysteine carboxylmethyltransferase family protein [Casimicrobiaceae bacterium]
MSHAAVLYVAIAIWSVPELIGGFLQRAEPGAARRDRGSYAVLRIAFTVGIAGAIIASRRVPAAAFVAYRGAIFWAGIALMLGGVAFRWYAIRVLGRYFTRDVATREGQRVVESGPYRWIRHPSYTGILMTAAGFGLALGNALALAIVLIGVLAGLLYRVAVEERALATDLGQPYRTYMLRTRRFIPFLW